MCVFIEISIIHLVKSAVFKGGILCTYKRSVTLNYHASGISLSDLSFCFTRNPQFPILWTSQNCFRGKKARFIYTVSYKKWKKIEKSRDQKFQIEKSNESYEIRTHASEDTRT